MNYNTEAIACRLEGGYTAALAKRQKFTLVVSGSTVKMVHNNHSDRGVGCASANANDVYADYASNNVWTFSASDNYANSYSLTLSGFGRLDVDDKWGGKLTVKDGKGYTDWAFIPETSLTDGSFAKWMERKAMYEVYKSLVASGSTSTYNTEIQAAKSVYDKTSATVDELRAATRTLIIATADGIQQATNVSALFTNSNMQQDGTADWTTDNVDRSAGAIENHWATTAITLTQSKTDIPNGLYTLVFRGMYRTGDGDVPYFQAVSGENSNLVSLPLMTDIASRWSVRGTDEWAGSDNSKIPNKLWRAAEGLAYEGASAKINNFKVVNNTLTLTIKVTSTAQWVPFQCFDIIYCGPTNLALYKQVVAKKTEAEGLVASAATSGAAKLLNDAIDAAAALNSSSEEEDLNNALNALTTAVEFANACTAPYTKFTSLRASANTIAAVAYNETVSGAYTTFEGAIATQSNNADNATNVEDINGAFAALQQAVKTYIAGAEPKNDGEYFDITCLMANPSFDNNSKEGWSYLSAPGVSWGNCEYYESEFDINQTVEGLPTGSYSLSVQAFQRPGWADAVWTAYSAGTNNASSVLYINSITSNVKNIMADAQESAKLGTGNWGSWPNDSRVGQDGGFKYIPNSQQGAKLYFDANLYDASCAAVVTDEDGGSLKLGFKSTKNHVSGDWTIFDNFRLYYYGSSLLVYYKQYLPQLKSEASADLSNGAYVNVTGSEKTEFENALAATPESETEAAYKDVIDDITAKQKAFREAVASYDALVAAKAYAELTKISANIGTAIFQYNEKTNNSLWSAYNTAKGTVSNYTVISTSTAAAIQEIVDALDAAISNYNNQPLNAPDATKRYYLNIVEDGKDWDGNAVTFIAGGRGDMGGYGIKYLAPSNANLNQALKFTAVEGETNTYKVSAVRPEGGEKYLTTGSTYEGGNNDQIRTTDDADKAMWVKVEATTTGNQFQIRNMSANKIIANNDNNDMYTANSANFTIAEASQATVNVSIDEAVKYGTRIFPFTPALNGVTFYSCETTADNSALTLVEVETPAADTPYIIYAENGLANTDLTGWGVAKAMEATVGSLTGVYASTAAPVGSYVLQKNNNKVGFYEVADGKQPTVGAYRCYLTDLTNSARGAFFFEDETTTAIDAIDALTSGDAQIFNANGAQLPALQKGMNIIKKADGTSYKVIVK